MYFGNYHQTEHFLTACDLDYINVHRAFKELLERENIEISVSNLNRKLKKRMEGSSPNYTKPFV